MIRSQLSQPSWQTDMGKTTMRGWFKTFAQYCRCKGQSAVCLHDSKTQRCRKVCVNACDFLHQRLGGLYQCDYPAAHDSEYKKKTHGLHHHVELLDHHSFQHKLLISEHVTVRLPLLSLWAPPHTFQNCMVQNVHTLLNAPPFLMFDTYVSVMALVCCRIQSRPSCRQRRELAWGVIQLKCASLRRWWSMGTLR